MLAKNIFCRRNTKRHDTYNKKIAMVQNFYVNIDNIENIILSVIANIEQYFWLC